MERSVNRRKILGLTLHQPWASLVAEGFKGVENRTWAPHPEALAVGDLIAVHAGIAVRPDAWGGAVDIATAAGIIDDVPLLGGFRRVETDDTGMRFARQRIRTYCEKACRYGAVVAVARFGGVVRSASDLPLKQRVWFCGPVGWILHPVLAVAPVPMRGARGLFPLDDAQIDQLRLVFRAALHARTQTRAEPEDVFGKSRHDGKNSG